MPDSAAVFMVIPGHRRIIQSLFAVKDTSHLIEPGCEETEPEVEMERSAADSLWYSVHAVGGGLSGRGARSNSTGTPERR